MGEHYELCEQYSSGDGLPCICELLTQHADDMHIAMTGDLRAKVETLRDEAMDHARAGLPFAPAIIAYQTVLALIDGSNQ